MIDGIKILCVGTNAKDWLNNSLLDFNIKVNPETGEIKSNKKIALYNGLKFHLIPSTTSKKVHCILKGSLAKYFNNGINNALDFTFADMQKVITELEHTFNIVPQKAIIQTFEIGVNITPPVPAKTVILNLRAYGNSKFTYYKEHGTQIGKDITKQEYRYKVYDKKKQSKVISKTEILRFEYSVNSTKKAKKHGVTTLSDLLNLNNIIAFKPYIIDMWQDAIFYDKGMNWRSMNDKQKKKILYYLDATNWQKFTKMQRKRAKEHFVLLMNEFCTSTTQKDISLLIAQKFNFLTAEKCYHLRNFSSPQNNKIDSVKMLPFTHLDKDVKSNKKQSPKKPKNLINQNVKKMPKNTKRKCLMCSADIEHKKQGAKYCSKTCNNIQSNKTRTKKRHQLKKQEQANLKIIVKNLHLGTYWLYISYKLDGISYTDYLHQSEIESPPLWWVWRVHQMQVHQTDKQELTILTTLNAKDLIKEIVNFNNK